MENLKLPSDVGQGNRKKVVCPCLCVVPWREQPLAQGGRELSCCLLAPCSEIMRVQDSKGAGGGEVWAVFQAVVFLVTVLVIAHTFRRALPDLGVKLHIAKVIIVTSVGNTFALFVEILCSSSLKAPGR